jgi:hypothetical protein
MVASATSGEVSAASCLTLAVAPVTLDLVAEPAVRAVLPGNTAAYTLSVTASEGFGKPLTLGLQGAPSGASVSFNPNQVTPPATSQLLITTTASVSPGTYPITATGSSQVVTGTASLTLVVASVTPSFALSISPTTNVASPNQAVSYTAFVTRTGSSSLPVSLAVAGLPTGVGAAWSVNPVMPDDASILTLSIPSSLPVGDYPLRVVANADTHVVSKSIQLIVSNPHRIYLPTVLKELPTA